MCDQLSAFEVPLYLEPNPCVHLFGRGPEGAVCKTCSHLTTSNVRSRRTFYKCDQRRMSHGAATDHRVRWRACGRYEKE